jgi:tRNA modification GTPase
MSANTTIAAIATPGGTGGIAVVRLSGPRALAIADRVVSTRGAPPSHRPAQTLLYGQIHMPDTTDRIIDEAVVLVFRAPHSYTCEDVVEIQCHGGRAVSRRILEAVFAAGAQPAAPGEFTRRAFLNGRLDLVQAEAVMDLIRSTSDQAAELAMRQLDGELSCSFVSIYEMLIDVAGELEATLDFGEHELPATTGATIRARLAAVCAQIRELLATWNEGHLLREGALVAICGRPNAGKSTLMNALLGKDRAIVTPLPGTTRDLLEEQIILEGIPIRLVDTAGLRDTTCQIEQAGIERAQQSLRSADVLLWIVDGSQPLSKDELAFLRDRDPARCVVIINKTDIAQAIDDKVFIEYATCRASLRTGVGLPRIKQTLLDRLGILPAHTPHAAIATRHRLVLESMLDALQTGTNLLADDFEAHAVEAADFIRHATEQLGELIGRHYTTDLLDNIFHQFCIGK